MILGLWRWGGLVGEGEGCEVGGLVHLDMIMLHGHKVVRVARTYKDDFLSLHRGDRWVFIWAPKYGQKCLFIGLHVYQTVSNNYMFC